MSAVKVDLPAPLGPTTTTHSPAATVAQTSTKAWTAGMCRFADMTDARGWRVTETDSAETSTWSPGLPEPHEAPEVRVANGVHSTRSTSNGRGAGTPGTQTPCATSNSVDASRVAPTGPSALTRPCGSSTTRRSTPCTTADSSCSTITNVAPEARTADVIASRTIAADDGSSIEVGSSSSTSLGVSARTPANASRW